MPIAVREAHDLVLDRRAVARPDARDAPRVHRRTADVVGDDLVRRRVGPRHVTRHLRQARERRGRGVAEGTRIGVALLDLHAVPVERSGAHAWRRTGLEATELQLQPRHVTGEPFAGAFSDATTRGNRFAHVHDGAQERAGGQDRGSRSPLGTVLQAHAAHMILAGVLLDDQTRHGATDQLDAVGGPDLARGFLAIEVTIGLAARRAHGSALARVEHPELDPGRVGHAPHRPTERNDLALAEPPDRGVAAHLTDLVQVEGHQRHARTQARGSQGRLDARMPAADDDHVDASGRVRRRESVRMVGHGGAPHLRRGADLAKGRVRWLGSGMRSGPSRKPGRHAPLGGFDTDSRDRPRWPIHSSCTPGSSATEPACSASTARAPAGPTARPAWAVSSGMAARSCWSPPAGPARGPLRRGVHRPGALRGHRSETQTFGCFARPETRRRVRVRTCGSDHPCALDSDTSRSS